MTNKQKPKPNPALVAMRRISNLVNGGRVTVTLADTRRIYAHAYPTTESARNLALSLLRAEGHESVGLEEVAERTNREYNRALGHGKGATIEEALDALGKALTAPLAKPTERRQKP